MEDLSGKCINQYQLISKQGLGGMAVVYQAYDLTLEREVAVKLIRNDAFPVEDHVKVIKRFEKEAKAQSKFSHPNIAPVYDFGEFDGMPYLIMPFYSSGTIKDMFGKPIGLQLALQWVIPIADALSYAHQLGIVHRDIKPSNILLNGKNQPILTDFGIAKLLEESDSTLTETGFGGGTPEYMAPEQWHGQATKASDQYSLAVVFFQILVGMPPYTAETPIEIAIKQMNDPIPSVRNYVHTIPEKIDRILQKALSYEAKDRYRSVQELMRELILFQTNASLVEYSGVPEKSQRGMVDTTYPKNDINHEDITIDFLKESAISDKLCPVQKNGTRKSGYQYNRWVMGLLLGALLIALVIFIVSLNRGNVSIISKGPTQQIIILNVALDQEWGALLDFDKTPLPSIPAPTNTITPTQEDINPEQEIDQLDVISSRFRDADEMEMVYIPAGYFVFGSDTGDYSISSNPVNETIDIFLESFWIDKYEVTNRQYAQCVTVGTCQAPYNNYSSTRAEYHSNPDYANFPVIHVDWNMAMDYCEWVGGRIPSELEWEKAARGTDERSLPWGDYWSTDKPANFNEMMYTIKKGGDTTPVGNYPDGASPFGVMDMLGNVWEWAMDWQESAAFATQSMDVSVDFTTSGKFILRGGSYERGSNLLARARFHYTGTPLNQIGFRCVVGDDGTDQ